MFFIWWSKFLKQSMSLLCSQRAIFKCWTALYISLKLLLHLLTWARLRWISFKSITEMKDQFHATAYTEINHQFEITSCENKNYPGMKYTTIWWIITPYFALFRHWKRDKHLQRFTFSLQIISPSVTPALSLLRHGVSIYLNQLNEWH